MTNTPIKACIFDLDGVITDTAHYHYLAWKALAESIGISFDEAFNEKLKGVGRMESLQLILALGNQSDSFSDEDKARMASEKNQHYQTLIKAMTPADVLPGIPELITQLKAQGIRIGLASASKNALSVLNSLAMLDAFDYVADAALIPHSKPAPDIFLDVMQQFNLTPKDCIGIEDAAAGVESILSAGMFAVGVGDESSLNRAHLVFPATQAINLENIFSAFEKWQSAT